MKIFVLGGDGFCGWPTALKLAKNHEVHIVDNLSRRKIDYDLKSNSLTPIYSIHDRINAAFEQGLIIKYHDIDIARDYYQFTQFVMLEKPDVIVHFAEQRAAPYSMLGQHERRYTVDNNVIATHNVLNAIVDNSPDTHLVHLGTMGVYGYSKEMGSIPEGYLDITVKETGEDASILYPTNPGSVYHMTKSLDQLLFQFYNKNWGVRITDLHQGIVWGTQTDETALDPRLVNRFDYDGIYGTVLNRFISQAASGNDLTVYGTGGQKRAFIHIKDTANCVKLAAENPPEPGKVRILNQVSEVRQVKELAEIISRTYGSNIVYHDNPRKELAENELEVDNTGLRSLGFEPITLSVNLIDDVRYIAEKMKENLKPENIMTSPKW
jgi:UDP-sulfoquinovose synthase